MKSCEPQQVFLAKNAYGIAIEYSINSSVPEPALAWNGDTFGAFTPQLEMQLDGNRHLRIEAVASPSPVAWTTHRR